MAFGRKLYGQWQNNPPSRFINELPPSCIEIINNTGYATPQKTNGYNNSYGSSKEYYTKHSDGHQNSRGGYRYGGGYNRYKKTEKHGYFDSYESVAYDEYVDYNETYPQNDYFYQKKKTSPLVGLRVYHISFGYGRIVDVDGDKCEVNFDKVGKKKILSSFLEKC